MTIGIGSDHKGFILKKDMLDYFSKFGYTMVDYGTSSLESADYPKYAFLIGEAVRDQKIDLGILICGTGIGMSIACNKVKKVRCAKVDNLEEASLARLHNNANVIAINCNNENAMEIAKTFIETKFSNEERHIRRIAMIDNYDN